MTEVPRDDIFRRAVASRPHSPQLVLRTRRSASEASLALTSCGGVLSLWLAQAAGSVTSTVPKRAIYERVHSITAPAIVLSNKQSNARQSNNVLK